jgi:hypothetical protein
MACSWLVLHRLRNWKRKLQPLGRKRQELCGKPSMTVVVKLDLFTREIELCKAHQRLTERKIE